MCCARYVRPLEQCQRADQFRFYASVRSVERSYSQLCSYPGPMPVDPPVIASGTVGALWGRAGTDGCRTAILTMETSIPQQGAGWRNETTTRGAESFTEVRKPACRPIHTIWRGSPLDLHNRLLHSDQVYGIRIIVFVTVRRGSWLLSRAGHPHHDARYS